MAKIAIMDDNVLSARALGVLLGQMGHTAACIAGSTDALDALRQVRPDLLVLDVDMPGMDGLEVLRQLRQDDDLRGLSVLMFSGELDPDTQAEAYQMGALDFIVKGRDWRTMRQRIAKHISAHPPVASGSATPDSSEQASLRLVHEQ